MVKKKISNLKNIHNEKIGIIKKNHKAINAENIKNYETDLKKIESLLISQLDMIKDLENDYSFEDEGAEYFEREFNDHIEKFGERMEAELDLIRKVANPFYDGKTRFEKYSDFLKSYDSDLIQKKGVIERLKESLSKLKFPSIESKKKENKDSSAKETKKEETKIEKEENEIKEASAQKEISATEKVETQQENEDGEQVSKVSEETLIAKLKNANEIQEEYDVKTAAEDNSVKLKLEVKITHNADNSAWAFVYQKYYNVPDSATFKSGQVKGCEKLTKLRQEYLDRLIAQISDLVMNKETYNDVKDKLHESLRKDDVNIY